MYYKQRQPNNPNARRPMRDYLLVYEVICRRWSGTLCISPKKILHSDLKSIAQYQKCQEQSVRRWSKAIENPEKLRYLSAIGEAMVLQSIGQSEREVERAIGTDMSKWKTVKHFTSWLGLSPHNEKTGGKVIRSKTKKTDNRANRAFRLAAASLGRSQSALGVFYRRMKAKLGIPKAVVATAHKLARIVYHLLKYQVPFSALPPIQEDARYRERALRNLQRKALKLGARIVIDPPSETQAHELVS